MGRSTAIYVALILTLCIAGFKPGDGVNGKWEGLTEGPQGEYNVVYTFKTQDTLLTGSVITPMGDTVSIANGKIKGDSFSFDVTYNGNTYHHDCVIAGDTISMKIEGGMGGDMTAKLARAKD